MVLNIPTALGFPLVCAMHLSGSYLEHTLGLYTVLTCKYQLCNWYSEASTAYVTSNYPESNYNIQYLPGTYHHLSTYQVLIVSTW